MYNWIITRVRTPSWNIINFPTWICVCPQPWVYVDLSICWMGISKTHARLYL